MLDLILLYFFVMTFFCEIITLRFSMFDEEETPLHHIYQISFPLAIVGTFLWPLFSLLYLKDLILRG